MIKHAIYGTVALAMVSTLVFGRDVLSYVKTVGRSTRNAIKAEVPIEFELQRARDMVNNLLPDIRQCMHVIAEEEVNVEHVTKEIARHESDLTKQKGEILALRSDVGQNKQTYKYAGRTYSSHDIQRDLSQRFERYKTAEATLASKRQILQAREKSIVAAREKMEGMLSAKRDLEVQIENLDARVKTIQAAQTASNVQLDDSQLSRAKKLIGDLNKQLDVAQKMLDAEGKFTGLVPVETAPAISEDLPNQIDEYFGKPTQPEKSAERSTAGL